MRCRRPHRSIAACAALSIFRPLPPARATSDPLERKTDPRCRSCSRRSNTKSSSLRSRVLASRSPRPAIRFQTQSSPTRRRAPPPNAIDAIDPTVCQYSWQVPRSYGLAHLLESRHVARQCLAISELVRAVSSLRVQEIEQARSAALVGILGDVARLLRLIDVPVLIELNNFVVRA